MGMVENHALSGGRFPIVGAPLDFKSFDSAIIPCQSFFCLLNNVLFHKNSTHSQGVIRRWMSYDPTAYPGQSFSLGYGITVCPSRLLP